MPINNRWNPVLDRNKSKDRFKYLRLSGLHCVFLVWCLNSPAVETSLVKVVPAIALSVIVLWFLWVQVQFCFGQVITNRAGERIHLSGVWQRGSGCETLSQLKGLSSVSTLRCLYGLIQRAETGWQRGLQQQPYKTHMHSIKHTQRHVKGPLCWTFHVIAPQLFTATGYSS